jgi:hypothetical protein
MHSLTLVSNLLTSQTQRRIVLGPYGFATTSERLSWIDDFKLQLHRINRDHLHPYEADIEVEYQRLFDPDAEPAPTVTSVATGLLAAAAHGAVMEPRAKAS